MKMAPVSEPKMDAPELYQRAGEELERRGQFLLAVKLFEMGRVTTGQAAGMCGMASVDFVLAAQRTSDPARASITL